MTHATLAENALVDDGNPRRRREVDVDALALNHEVHGQTGAHKRRFLKRFKAIDRIPVDPLHQIAGLKPGSRSRGARLYPANASHMLNSPEGHEHAGENDERQYEICNRPGEHDRRAVAQGLTSERQRAVDRWIHVGALADARGVGVAVKLDISAKRERADPPPGAARVHAREQLMAEAERKRVDFDPAPPADEIVAQFVHGDDQAQDYDERNYVPSEPSKEVGDRVHARHLRRLQVWVPHRRAAGGRMVTERLLWRKSVLTPRDLPSYLSRYGELRALPQCQPERSTRRSRSLRRAFLRQGGRCRRNRFVDQGTPQRPLHWRR